MKKTVCLIVLFLTQLTYSQSIKDTIVIDKVFVSNIPLSDYFKDIRKNYEKNLNTKNTDLNYSFNIKNNNEKLIDSKIICNTNIKKELFKREFPKCVNSLLSTNFFNDLDDGDSPFFILTNSRLFYFEISELLGKINVNAVEYLEEEFYIDFSFKYRDYDCILRVDKETKNILLFNMKLVDKLKSSTRKTKGTIKYTNSETKYKIDFEEIDIQFVLENGQINFKSFTHTLDIESYSIKVYDENKENKLLFSKNYSFKVNNQITAIN